MEGVIKGCFATIGGARRLDKGVKGAYSDTKKCVFHKKSPKVGRGGKRWSIELARFKAGSPGIISNPTTKKKGG